MHRTSATDPSRMPVLRARSLATALLAVAAAALALALAGCGGSTSATLDPVAQAAEATAHAGGARMTLRATIASDDGTDAQMDGSGIFNMAREEGQLTFQLSGVSGAAAGALSALGTGKLQFTELFKSGLLYMHTPLFAGKLPGGATWLKLNLKKVQEAEGIDTQSLSSAQSDPAQFLRYLKADGGTVTDKGQATVGGVPTTRYTGSIDLEKAAETLPTNDRAKLEAALKNVAAKTGGGKIPFEVWIDAQHRVRRMHMVMSFTVSGKNIATTIDYTLSEFGVQPGVNLPSDSEAFDATQLGLSQLSAG